MPTPLALPPPAPLPDLEDPRPRARAARGANRYEVVRPLGISATSEVVLAVAHGPMGFERPVVLKRVLPDVPGGAAELATARLGREARAYARLAHPAIVSLLDFVEDAGRLTLVLEHVDGLSLARVVDDLRACGESLDDASVWYLGYRIFVALAAAHAARDPMTGELAQVIHRDVCPDNVLVPWDGFVKLTDFGVARLVGVSSDTRPGVIKGTVGYLAPEQVRGEAVTVRTDVYAACLVMRELLLRAPVFPRDRRGELELLGAMAEPDLVPLAVLRPALPVDLTDAIDRGLAADPEDRNVTAEEIASLIQNAWSLEAARGRLVDQIATLRRRQEPSPRGHAVAVVPDRIAAVTDGRASLFDESTRDLDVETETAPTLGYAAARDSQGSITKRPPGAPETEPPVVTPVTSMVMPCARRRPSSPSSFVPLSPPPARTTPKPTPTPRPLPRVAPAPPFAAPPSASRPAWLQVPRADHRAPSPLVFGTPDAMSTSREIEALVARRAPRDRGRILAAFAAAAITIGVVSGAALGLRERAKATEGDRAPSAAAAKAGATAHVSPVSPTTTTTTTTPTTTHAPPLATAAPVPRLTSAPAVATGAPRETTGRLLTDAGEKGHRIFVDGRFAGGGGAPLVVRCGRHDVRVGSAGRLRTVDVPCGGDLAVAR